MPSQYPGSLDTTTTLSTAVNGLTALLNGDHTSGATTITVNSTAGAPSAGYFTIDSEVIKYAGTTPTTLTGCTRGADSTAAASHNNGATVKFGLVADHHNSLVTAIIGAQTKLGTNTNGASATSIDGNQLAATTVNYSKLVIPLVGNLRHTTAYKAKATNFGAGNSGGFANTTFGVIGLSVKEYDLNNNWDTVNFRYTVPITGYYYVAGMIAWNNGANAGRFISLIYKNGVEVTSTRGSIDTVTAGATHIINLPTTPTILALTAGDLIQLFGWQNSGLGTPFYRGQGAGDDCCALTIHYVSE